MSRLYKLILAVVVPLTAVTWLFQLNHSASSAPDASALDVVISEIAWAGTTSSFNDEWLELANNTVTDIDLAGWQLVRMYGT